jgi:hypothetical protein
MQTSASDIQATTKALATSDRCDRCQAQAYVRVVLPAGTDLLFCAHHWSTYEAALRPKAAEVIDETHRLFEPAHAEV